MTVPPTAASSFKLRAAASEDRSEIAELICISLNYWYHSHTGRPVFAGGPAHAAVFFDVYNELEPGCCVVAEDTTTGRLAGSCFYHPRPTHVSLGIMNVHPNYFGRGIANALLRFITDFTDKGGYPALRLISSAGNLDSFSLYSRAGFVARTVFQDLVVPVPESGLRRTGAGAAAVRDAKASDATAMAALETQICGVDRGGDYAFCIANRNGFWHVSVYENAAGGIDGYMISSGHEALNILGPSVSRTEEAAAALMVSELDRYRGRTPLVILPVDHPNLVRLAYECGARNVELHLGQVRGVHRPIAGVVMPTFLLETG